MSEHDSQYQDLITCPHCGYKDKNTWECGMGDGDQEDRECGECEKSFSVVCQVSRTFSSAPLEEKETK
jgi:hypothetical protein